MEVVVQGLLHPVGLAAGANGAIFIAEAGSGNDDMSAGVSLMTGDGEIGRIVSGLPSDHETGEFLGAVQVAYASDMSTLYFGSIGVDHLWSLSLDSAQTTTLPAQAFQPDLLQSLLTAGAEGGLAELTDITFDGQGLPIVVDAAGGQLLSPDSNGSARRVYQLLLAGDETADPSTFASAPSGVAFVDGEYYVSLKGDCPYPSGSGRLIAIGENGAVRTIAEDLTVPVDVAAGTDGTIWLLEYAQYTPEAPCTSGEGYRPNTGRLSRISEERGVETVLTGLDYPGAILPMPDGSIYVTEVYNGRILRLAYEAESPPQTANSPLPQLELGEPEYRALPDMDAALSQVIEKNQLSPNPGAELREADTPLARLGQALFFDPILSGDRNVACSTCHHPELAMGDGRVLSIGTGGHGLGPGRDYQDEISIGPEGVASNVGAGVISPLSGSTILQNPFDGSLIPRNSPTVINAALLPAQFWDGRVANYAVGEQVQTLEEEVNALGLDNALVAQALFPITSMHEMAGVTLGDLETTEIRQLLLARLNAEASYRQMFSEVYGTDRIEMLQVVEAIAAFERRLIFTESPWDDYLLGDTNALSEQQKRGALLFFGELSPATNCAQCHQGDLFTDLQFHNLLVPQLGPGKGQGEEGKEDWGRSMVSFDWRDQYAFRTPGLRNVELTAPYFHSGAYATLEDVIRHHANIWQSAAGYDPAKHLPSIYFDTVRPFQPEKQVHSVAPELKDGLPLSETDIADLVAFLHSLTDPSATDLSEFTPDEVPSGLPLDPVPDR